MSKYIRHLGIPLALGAALIVGACKSEPKQSPEGALSSDSSLKRDLAMAGHDSAVQPQLHDVAANPPAATPAPSAPAPRPARTPKPSGSTASKPSAPAPTATTTPNGNTVTTNPGGSNSGGGAVGMIPAGSTLQLAAASQICTNTNNVGDHVTATVNEAVPGSNGAAIPAGATVNLTVTQLKRSENANDPIVMEFAVNSVSFGGKTYPVEGTVTSAAVDRIKDQPRGKDVQKVATGAAIGAIAGKLIGKSTKATVIGGAAGAAAGAATAAATANYQGCIEPGGSIVVKLTSATQVRVS